MLAYDWVWAFSIIKTFCSFENMKLVGALYYICYFIYSLMDDNVLTPKDAIWGMAEYDVGYYPLIILEYLIIFPLWMWIWNNALSPFFYAFYVNIFKK